MIRHTDHDGAPMRRSSWAKQRGFIPFAQRKESPHLLIVILVTITALLGWR